MKTVLVHGCFDVIHHGHLKHFQEAKKYGGQDARLIVSVTADKFVRKGPCRPYFNAERRIEMLKALAIVDDAFIADEPTAVETIKRIKPDFYVKGPDYKDFAKDVTGEILNEKKAVEEVGGTLVFTEEETFSSSTIINKFFAPWTEQQRNTIDTISDLGGIDAIDRAIGQLAGLRVLVVGEPILDIYRFVTPEGISSKSPSISARFNYEEQYRGGSLAIQNHLLGFTNFVNILTGPVQKKIRYISGQQRVFEVTEIDDKPKNLEFLGDKLLELDKKSDLIILADFGHGLFEGEMLNACKETKAFTALNVQANSSNYGFNVFTKHERFDYLCLDTREGRLALHDRYSDPMSIAERISKSSGRALGFTCGPNGAYLFKQDGRHIYSPAFSDNVVDAIGAGDAYFAITSALLKVGCKEELIPFIGNVFAGLKTKIIGNKSSVSKASLLKACAGILK